MSGVLIDANLLCLFVVGSLGKGEVAGHARLKAFGFEDYLSVRDIIDNMGDPVLCPHVLAETANLIAYRKTPSQQARLRAELAFVIEQCAERSMSAQSAIVDDSYDRLGLTDAVLLTLASDKALLLLSVDLALCLEAERRGLRVLNYNYVRDGAIRLADVRR